MNYAKQISRSDIAKRAIATWVLIAAIFFTIGIGCGYALRAHISPRDKSKTGDPINGQSATQTTVFGAYEGPRITHEIALDWGGDELDFEPLECDMPDEQQEFLYYLCDGYDLDFALVMAVIQRKVILILMRSAGQMTTA